MGDIVSSQGWDLRNFLRNPVDLFSHRSDFLVGTWKNLRVDANQLKGELQLAPEGTSDRIDEIRRLVEAGILRATSVGFRPLVTRPRGKDLTGVIFEKQELVECSLCAVPANPATLAVVKSLGGISDDVRNLVFAQPGAAAVATKRAPARPALKVRAPSIAVEARVAELQAERKQLMRRLVNQIERLAAAQEEVAVIAETGGFEELPAALKRMRGCETMARAISTLLGVTERELFGSEQEAERLKRVRDSVARSMKGRRT
jgi:HK97 family phage prohead protease